MSTQAAVARQCVLCGRQGTRYFTSLGLGYVCTYTVACAERREQFFARRMRRPPRRRR